MTSILFSAVAILALSSVEARTNLNQMPGGIYVAPPPVTTQLSSPPPAFGQDVLPPPPAYQGFSAPPPAFGSDVAPPPPAYQGLSSPPPAFGGLSSPPPVSDVIPPPPTYKGLPALPQYNVYTPPAPVPVPMTKEPEMPPSYPTGLPYDDYDLLNFGLQLKCLTAEFYAMAAYGYGLSPQLLGGGPGSFGGKQATLNGPSVRAYAEELAMTEVRHLKLIREKLGPKALQCPLMDLGGSFQDIGDRAANKTLSLPYTPYSGDLTFSLAVFLFSDVSVSAYNGIMPYIQDREILKVASQISNAQAYEAGAVRMFLGQNVNTGTEYGATAGQITNLISNLRNIVADDGWQDVGVLSSTGQPQVINDDEQGLTQARSPSALLKLVKPFFPMGLNGYFK